MERGLSGLTGEGGVERVLRAAGGEAKEMASGNFGTKEVGMTEFLYGEVELAAATGIHARVFQRLRLKELKEGSDWKLSGQKVVYGKNALARALELATGEKVKKSGAIAGLPLNELERRCLLQISVATPPVTAIMARFFPNRHLIGATLADGKLIHVRVKSAKNFRRGMELPLRWNEGVQMFELARKLPRFPGRW